MSGFLLSLSGAALPIAGGVSVPDFGATSTGSFWQPAANASAQTKHDVRIEECNGFISMLLKKGRGILALHHTGKYANIIHLYQTTRIFPALRNEQGFIFMQNAKSCQSEPGYRKMSQAMKFNISLVRS